MADNTTLNTGSGGDTFRTLEDGSSVKWPVGITAFAASVGTPDVLTIVTPAAGLPVHQQTGGTWAVSLASAPLPTDAATATLQGTGNTSLASIDTKLSGSLTVATHAVTQSGTWTVTGTGGTFPVTDSGGSLTVDAPVGTPVFVRLSDGTSAITTLPVSLASVPSHAVTNAGTFAVQVSGALPAGTNNIGDVDVLSLPALPAGTNNIGDVDVLTLPAVTIAAAQTIATVTTVGTVTALTTCSTVTTVGTLTGSGVAHDAADSGNPHKIGFKATTSLSGLTLVAGADRTDAFAGVDGVQITRPHCNLEDIVTGNANNTDGTSTACIASSGAGVKTYLTSVVLTNTSASNIYVEIKDGTSVKVTIPVPANGGAIFNPPVPLPGAAATAWNFDPSAATTTVYCSMIGFKSKV